jgi:hypothetical protein
MGEPRSGSSPPRGQRLPRGERGQIITGRLQEHGPANYQFEPNGSPSYYLKLITDRGVETLWGTDLQRAISHSKSQPQIDDVIGVQRVGTEEVTIPARKGDWRTDRERTFHRTTWRVETAAYLAIQFEQARNTVKSYLEDKQALRERPELRSAFISLHIAEQYAQKHIRDPRDQELFVNRVKAVMAASIQNGKPIPEPRVINQQRAQNQSSGPQRAQAPRIDRTL